MPSHHPSLTNSYSSLKTQSNFMYQLLNTTGPPMPPFPKTTFLPPTPGGWGGGSAEVLGPSTTAAKGFGDAP